MTAKRKDTHSTEFGLWLREQKEIDSELGYTTTNLDYIWKNCKNGKYYLIEEKRYTQQPRPWQQKIFDTLDAALKSDVNYKGFHLIVFENTSPDDGWINLDHKRITKAELIKFLKLID